MAVYNVRGTYIVKDLPFFGKEALGSLTAKSSLTANGFYWGEYLTGSRETPFHNIKALYNGSMAQADYRVITYEDGSPIVENGKLYFSMSTQIAQGSPGAIVCELDVSTCKLKMTGAILAVYNDNYFTATGNLIFFDRNTGLWQLGTHTQDSAGHILLHAASVSDPRFGVSKIVYSQLDYENPGSGDEDQQIFYSSELEKWVLIYVAIRNNDTNYILRMQTSDYCDRGFEFVREVNDSSRLRATGVYSTKVGGVRYVLSGSSASGTNKFLAYSFPDLSYVGELNLDIPTGADSGIWPIVVPITNGGKTDYYLFTFDRAATVTTNKWSYGCAYMYKADESNTGTEYFVKRNGLNVGVDIVQDYSITQLHFKRLWSIRRAMDLEIPLSEINLDSAVLFSSQSDIYPSFGSAVLSQDATGLKLAAPGNATIIGGKHQTYAAYILSRHYIQNDDRRGIAIFDDKHDVKMRVLVTKNGSVYGYNGTTETLMGTMRENSTELIVCTGGTLVTVYEK